MEKEPIKQEDKPKMYWYDSIEDGMYLQHRFGEDIPTIVAIGDIEENK